MLFRPIHPFLKPRTSININGALSELKSVYIHNTEATLATAQGSAQPAVMKPLPEASGDSHRTCGEMLTPR